MPKPSIRDVARVAGVSRAAVSLVLNNGEIRIGDEKRKAIRQAAERLGYKPHAGARRLSLMRMETLALVFPYTSSALSQLFLYELTRDVAMAAQGHKYDILMNFWRPDEGNGPLADPGRVDGSILIFDRTTRGVVDRLLEKSDHPYIVLGGGFLDPPPQNFVDIDIRTGTREATQHLIDLGHRHLAFIAGVPSPVKYEGYTAALKQAGLEPSDPLVVDEGLAETDIEKAIAGLLARSPRPTAIVAANDTLAIRAIKILLMKGLRVPENVSVVGFDDTENASLITPGLTTVRIPLRELAETAVGSLIRQIEHSDAELVREIIPTRLMVRESSGPPPS